MRVVITGAGGQLGQELVPAFDGWDVVAFTHEMLDVGDRDAVLGAITTLAPDVVVHAGAWTAVDACEGDVGRAYRVNALGTRHVADGARRVNAYVCYVSTDYVFDGTKAEPYVEWDTPNPRSVYGRSKLGGEREVDPSSSIVRVSWVAGAGGNNMVKTVLKAAAADSDRVLKFVDDQRGSPTFTADLAVAIRRIASARLPGVFHVTNQGSCSWYEFVGDILEAGGYSRTRVEPIKTSELDPPRPAPRPANSVLDNAALRLSGLPLLPPYRESLTRLVNEINGS